MNLAKFKVFRLLHVKALVSAFNQVNALVGAFSVIVKTLPIVHS